jgi:hypothetical protein
MHTTTSPGGRLAGVARMTPTAGGEVALGAGARAMRVVHEAIAGVEIACLAYVWTCAVARRRDRFLRASVPVLGAITLAGFLALILRRPSGRRRQGRWPARPAEMRTDRPVTGHRRP